MITFKLLRRHRPVARRAAAAAELAICMPVLVTLVLASIEACTMIFLAHGLSITSYEGVRVAINYDATNADVMARCNEIIAQRGIAEANITIQPPNVVNVQRGFPITVTVSAPCDANALIPAWFYGGRTLTERTTMVKE